MERNELSVDIIKIIQLPEEIKSIPIGADVKFTVQYFFKIKGLVNEKNEIEASIISQMGIMQDSIKKLFVFGIESIYKIDSIIPEEIMGTEPKNKQIYFLLSDLVVKNVDYLRLISLQYFSNNNLPTILYPFVDNQSYIDEIAGRNKAAPFFQK